MILFTFLTLATLLCYSIDEYVSRGSCGLDHRTLWLITGTSAVVGWATMHRVGRTMFRLGHKQLAVQLFVLSYAAVGSAVLAHFGVLSFSRYSLPMLMFSFWPCPGVGHVTISGYLGGETLNRALFGPRGGFDDAKTYIVLLLPLFHLWLLGVLVATLAFLRRAVRCSAASAR